MGGVYYEWDFIFKCSTVSAISTIPLFSLPVYMHKIFAEDVFGQGRTWELPTPRGWELQYSLRPYASCHSISSKSLTLSSNRSCKVSHILSMPCYITSPSFKQLKTNFSTSVTSLGNFPLVTSKAFHAGHHLYHTGGCNIQLNQAVEGISLQC